MTNPEAEEPWRGWQLDEDGTIYDKVPREAVSREPVIGAFDYLSDSIATWQVVPHERMNDLVNALRSLRRRGNGDS